MAAAVVIVFPINLSQSKAEVSRNQSSDHDDYSESSCRVGKRVRVQQRTASRRLKHDMRVVD